jgi:NodT family efflux transporter outer membrane factor (OMF) lipoprotein
MLFFLTGCTSWRDYIHNGFKVGPNYGRPAAPVARQWIDANDLRVKTDEDDMCQWWTVFNDPVLNDMVCTAYHQNLTLREAGFRILEARAQLGITIGNLFPQTQNATGSYLAIANSQETAQGINGFGQQFFNQWNFGFNLAWELDFWGRFRRAIEENSDLLDASVEDYDGALVTLLGDVATAYVNMRTLEQRIKYAEDNVKIQKDTLDIVEARFKVSTISELDVDQARTTLEATEAAISELQIDLRQTILQLCTLMGMPPEDLLARVGKGPIPTTPKDVAVGIPADLLRRRPDVRAAERRLAAQCAAIGIADSEFYPHISIVGTLGWSAQNLGHLFEPAALNSNVGPSFQWDLLNYGRLLNNVKLQDASFQELLATYQQSVLNANQDVENGLVTFLRGQERTAHQQASVNSAVQAVNIALKQYQAGTADFTTVTQVEQIQVQQQDLLAQAEGEIGTGLITVYRALGGGWQIRLQGCNEELPPPPDVMYALPPTLETVPMPRPASPQSSGTQSPSTQSPGTQLPATQSPGASPPSSQSPSSQPLELPRPLPPPRRPGASPLPGLPSPLPPLSTTPSYNWWSSRQQNGLPVGPALAPAVGMPAGMPQAQSQLPLGATSQNASPPPDSAGFLQNSDSQITMATTTRPATSPMTTYPIVPSIATPATATPPVATGVLALPAPPNAAQYR